MKTHFKKVLAALFGALLAVGTIAVPTAASSFKTEVRDSCVVIKEIMALEDGSEDWLGWGTGFFVGASDEDPQYLVTNYHVVSDYVQIIESEQNTNGWYSYPLAVGDQIVEINIKLKLKVFYDSTTYDEAYLIDYDRIKDVAVLRLDNPTSLRVPLALLSPTDDMVGSPVYAVGFPGISENAFADATTQFDKSDTTVTSGGISRLITQSGTGVRLVQHDVVLRHGNSGGPLVDGNGAAIGINTYSYDNDSASDAMAYYAVNIDEVMPMLTLHSIKYELYTGEAPVNYTLFIVAGVLILVVILLIVFLIVRSAKKKKTKGEAQNGNATPQTVAGAAPAGANVVTPVVRSMASQHAGRAYEVTGNGITIGRGAGCAVVYQEGTPGVSGRHASLSFDPMSREFILTDLGSSYGTYLSNGQKLNANVPYRLKSGDSFYLGDKENVLRLEL